jgi:hypothetical protein
MKIKSKPKCLCTLPLVLVVLFGSEMLDSTFVTREIASTKSSSLTGTGAFV